MCPQADILRFDSFPARVPFCPSSSSSSCFLYPSPGIAGIESTGHRNRRRFYFLSAREHPRSAKNLYGESSPRNGIASFVSLYHGVSLGTGEKNQFLGGSGRCSYVINFFRNSRVFRKILRTNGDPVTYFLIFKRWTSKN